MESVLAVLPDSHAVFVAPSSPHFFSNWYPNWYPLGDAQWRGLGLESLSVLSYSVAVSWAMLLTFATMRRRQARGV